MLDCGIDHSCLIQQAPQIAVKFDIEFLTKARLKRGAEQQGSNPVANSKVRPDPSFSGFAVQRKRLLRANPQSQSIGRIFSLCLSRHLQ
jgi:hypothetical protein